MHATSTEPARSGSNDVAVAGDGIAAKIRVDLDVAGPKSFVRRTATIDGLEGSWNFGTHGQFLGGYDAVPGEFPEEPTTNEIFAAAVAACLTGTFAGVLRMRGIDLSRDNLTAEADVDIGPAPDDGKHIIRSVTLHLTVSVPEDQRATVERAHGFYHKECWLSQTLRGSRCRVSSTLSFA